MEKKERREREREREKEGGSRRDKQNVRNRLHSTPTNSPFVNKEKVEGIEHKGSPTL